MSLWDSYSLNETPPYWILADMAPAMAKAQFERTMKNKSNRIAELSALLVRFGIVLGDTDENIQVLNDWFVSAMAPLPDRFVPNGRSLSVCEDVALFLGDVMISRYPQLSWQFFAWGKKSVAYHQHVIMGFKGDRENFDLSGIVHGYATQVVGQMNGDPGHFEISGIPLFEGAKVATPPIDRRKFVRLLHAAGARLGTA